MTRRATDAAAIQGSDPDDGSTTRPEEGGIATADASLDAGAGPDAFDSGPPPAVLRIGTWNVARLGGGYKRIEDVARIIDRNLDVVMLTEVMTPLGLNSLLAYLPGWTSSISERAVGENGYEEYYAVIVRPGVARFTRSGLVTDTANEWVREPFVACLEAFASDFCLVGMHVVFGSSLSARDLEVQALARLVTRLRADAPNEGDFIVLGDFNRPGSATSFRSFTSIGYRFSDDGLTKTTLGASDYANPYDHVLFHTASSGEWLGDAVRVDFVQEYCAGNFSTCAANISDHAPFAISWRNTGVDDD